MTSNGKKGSFKSFLSIQDLLCRSFQNIALTHFPKLFLGIETVSEHIKYTPCHL